VSYPQSPCATLADLQFILWLNSEVLLKLPICPESIQHHSPLWELITVKPCIGWNRMSNQKKAEEVIYDIGVKFFLGCHCECWSKSRFLSTCSICPELLFSSPVIFQKSSLLNRWSFETVEWTVGHLRVSSFTLVFSPWSESPRSNSSFAISNCYSQSSQIWYQCQRSHLKSSWRIQW
jgi:hypothetical protein